MDMAWLTPRWSLLPIVTLRREIVCKAELLVAAVATSNESCKHRPMSQSANRRPSLSGSTGGR